MFRRIASVIDVSDVLGLIGLAIVGYGASLVDPRLPFFVIGGFLILVAVARAAPPAAP